MAIAVLLGTSFAISRYLFGWFPLPDGFALSEIHMFAVYWVMVIVGLRVGLNWNRVTALLRNLGAIWQPLVGSPVWRSPHRGSGAPLSWTSGRDCASNTASSCGISTRAVRASSATGWRSSLCSPSLVSLWSSAPYLLNKSVGYYANDPSVEGRTRAFEDGIGQMLWPERREKDAELGDKLPGKIDRTTARSLLIISRFSPDFLVDVAEPLRDELPWLLNANGDIELGPIPKGTPIGLLSNLDLRPDQANLIERARHDLRLLRLLIRVKRELKALPPDCSDEEARRAFRDLVGPMLELSKCPDLVVNRGHLFGTGHSAGIPTSPLCRP